ncbi:hypothetical protein OIU79_014104 [Salix purpurea]|uniref:Uncharacterized protein n=1 Tax=Salix purpurea TaxID=77065 RepID=A0A9Q0PQT6_SALPP|nr:hypothetical protein OIU79_014104 [Salix purpurea]
METFYPGLLNIVAGMPCHPECRKKLGYDDCKPLISKLAVLTPRLASKGAKVSWKSVSLPKQGGGLGRKKCYSITLPKQKVDWPLSRSVVW